MNWCKKVMVVLGLAVLLAGCSGISPYTYQGAGIGGAVGAGAGALLDHNNRWRGAMVGTLMGGAVGGAATELGRRAAQDDARQQYSNYPYNSQYNNSGYYNSNDNSYYGN